MRNHAEHKYRCAMRVGDLTSSPVSGSGNMQKKLCGRGRGVGLGLALVSQSRSQSRSPRTHTAAAALEEHVSYKEAQDHIFSGVPRDRIQFESRLHGERD